jgi:hypothetical protein
MDFLFPSRENPLHKIFPSEDPVANTPIPLIRFFALLSVAVHFNLALWIFPHTLQRWLRSKSIEIKALSYPSTYALSTVAPALCIFLGRPWYTVVWWFLTDAVVLLVQLVQASVSTGSQSIVELEKMKYRAPSA